MRPARGDAGVTSSLLSVLLVAASIAAAVYLVTPRGPEIKVRWRAGYAAAERRDAERTLGLVRGRPDGGATWVYQATRIEPPDLLAVVTHPGVEDTAGFDRGSPERLPFGTVLWRRLLGSLAIMGLVASMLPLLLRLARRSGRWRALAAIQVVGFVAGLAYWMSQTEFPYLDMFRSFDYVGRRAWGELAADVFRGTAEFRPLYFALLKTIHSLAGGPDLFVFRSLQLGLVAACMFMFMGLIDPRTESRWVGFSTGFLCFVGLHTSRFALSSSLTPFAALIVIACVLGSLLLLRRAPSTGLDCLALAASVCAVFLVEYGVVVGLVWAVAGALRMGSATRRTAALAVAGLVLYAFVRVMTNDAPVPGPFYTETGFGTRENLTVEEQRELFAGREWLFYGYNIAATALTVFFSEPRAGVYRVAATVTNGTQVEPWQLVQWVGSLVATLLLSTWFLTGGPRSTEQRRVLLLCGIAFAANCALGYLYTRDRIPTISGVCYAVAVSYAVGGLWAQRAVLSKRAAAGLRVAMFLFLCTWGLRGAGMVVWARDEAWGVKDEWVDRYDRLSPAVFPGTPPDDDRTTVLRDTLRHRAAARRLADPRDDPTWLVELFERKSF